MWWIMKCFGNGYGIAAPLSDQIMYWLHDTYLGRTDGIGRWYKFIGGLGAQLNSFEWRCPKPGTRRKLSGFEFAVFSAYRGRYGLMWSIGWADVDLPADLDAAHARIRTIKAHLGSR